MSQDSPPKSSVELAMERLRKKDEVAGVVETTLTDAQKAAIAELRSLYGAKLAQASLQHQDRLRATFDPAVREAADLEYQRGDTPRNLSGSETVTRDQRGAPRARGRRRARHP